MHLLITADDEPTAEGLAARLADAGLVVSGHVACRNLVREAVRLAPQAVIFAGAPDQAGWTALALLAASHPLPVLVLAPPPPAGPPGGETWIAAQVMAWMPADTAAAALGPALALARARFDHEQAQARALADTQARLVERKWVDRAKGVLMRARQMSEDEAFSLLRSASMQANLRLGEVSRGVVATAEAAEAVNRAGQMRMLSQRFVKALAQRLAGVDRSGGDAVLQNSRERLQANLDRLSVLVPEPLVPQLAEVQVAWQALNAGGEAAVPSLADADRCAETLLQSAERLTEALDQAGGRRSLKVVNQCGRQRMLAQRLAKHALLATLLDAGDAAAQAAGAVATITEFEAGLQALDRVPLTSDDIRAALARARGQWQRLRHEVAQPAAPSGRADAAAAAAGTIVHESEALLASFDHLTTLYEHSLQVLLG